MGKRMLEPWVGVLVLAALATAPARAVAITNVTTSTLLFYDNFEKGFSPSVGTWSIVGPDVTTTNAGSPGPAEGSFYASLFRNDPTENGQGNLQAQLSAAQTTNGDVVLLRMMVFLPDDGVDTRAQLMLDDGDFKTARAWVVPDGKGEVYALGPGFVRTDTGLKYTPGAWQEWDLQYAIGASTFSVSVNGVSASGFSSYTSGAVGFSDLFNGAWDPAGTFYLDAVPPQQHGAAPEPSTVGLMISGLLLSAFIGARSRSRVRSGGN